MTDASLAKPHRIRKTYPPIEVGTKFDRLTVIAKGDDYTNPSGGVFSRWWLVCECGKQVIRHQCQLLKGQSRDCGCGRRFQAFPIGERIGRLKVIGESYRVGRYWRTPCQCECGEVTLPFAYCLSAGDTKSCGKCDRSCSEKTKMAVASATTKHGWSGTAEYQAWLSMRSRCLCKTNSAYKNYGGRGITVCDEWKADFLAFLNHIGPKPSPDLSLDRIDNNDGYRPGNVRWADRSTQSRNRRPFTIRPGAS